jgi:hypothetical protein
VAVLAVLGFFGWVRAWALDRRVRALNRGAGGPALTRRVPGR